MVELGWLMLDMNADHVNDFLFVFAQPAKEQSAACACCSKSVHLSWAAAILTCHHQQVCMYANAMVMCIKTVSIVQILMLA